MSRLPRSLLLLPALLWAAAWLGLGTGTGGCSTLSTLNVPIDRDGDGLPDSVRAGDFDGDGVLEIDDLQDAMDALTDPGPKRIDVVAGVFSASVNPAARPGRLHGLLELRSFTTLACSSIEHTTLRAGPLTTTPAQDFAVVANDDHAAGNDEVWIRHCGIDGGAPPRYAGADVAKSQRMGVYFRRTRNSGVCDSWVHDTLHTGLYTSNSRGDRFLGNLVERAGSWGDTTGDWRQPCIYLFVFGGGEQLTGFEARGNTLRRCGNSGLNTRAEHSDAAGDVVRDLLWEDNTVEEAHSACAHLRGVERATVRNLTCRRTGPIALYRGVGSAYRFQGNDNASSDVRIEDVLVSEVTDGQAGLDVGAFVDGLALRRVRVEGTRDANGAPLNRDCAWIQRPLRNAVLEDVVLRDCGRAGAVVTSRSGGLGDASELLTFRRWEVGRVDQAAPLDATFQPAIDFVGPHLRLLLEDLVLSGASAPELRFSGGVRLSTLRRVEVDSIDPGWLAAFTESSAPPCGPLLEGRWITSLDGTSATDCTFGAGTGSTPARCGCTDGAWRAITWAATPGISFSGATVHSNVLAEDIRVKNARGVTGVRVQGTLNSFAVRTILGADDSLATNPNQRSAIDFDASGSFTVTNASCVGTQAGVPCVE
jgi:hypothetical protein